MTAEEVSKRRRATYLAILSFGIVSMFGDMVYEGSRGLVPDYFAYLGATSVIVGVIGGLGDFIGYALRLVSGVLVDATRSYWFFIFLGYGLIFSIPLIGFSGLEIAILLVLIERIGKALRSPSRDTVLSVIGKEVGAGRAFGFHELLDQVGAVLGPTIVALIMLSTSNNYRFTFGFLAVPFGLMLIFLIYTYKRTTSVPLPARLEKGQKNEKMTRPFYLYTFAVLINTVGLIPYTLILFKVSEIVSPAHLDWIVPLVFVLIQGVDAPAALLSGYAFDKFGIKFLVLPFVLSIVVPLFAMFNSGLELLIIAAAFFGLVLGMQESIYRAAVSQLAPVSSRGTAYGIFHIAYGAGLLISGFVYGLLIQFGLPFVVALVYVLATQSVAILLLLRASRWHKVSAAS